MKYKLIMYTNVTGNLPFSFCAAGMKAAASQKAKTKNSNFVTFLFQLS